MKHIVIIGNSAAGISAAQTIREIHKTIKISIISDEIYPAYLRYKIDEIMTKDLKPEELVFKQKEFYDKLKIDFRSGQKVEKVNIKKNNLVLLDKTRIDYDALIISTGMSAKIDKTIKGANKHGVLGFRNLNNIKDIFELIPISHSTCVWGHGIAAVKAAFALHKKGLEVKLITEKERILQDIVTPQETESIEKHLAAFNIETICNINIEEIFGNGDVKAIKLSSGKVIGCDILVVDKNLTPRTRFLEESGIVLERGIVVDEFLRASFENIFAAGDVLSRKIKTDELYDFPGSWERAVEQGKIAGNNALKFLESKPEEIIAYEPKLQSNNAWPFEEIKTLLESSKALEIKIPRQDSI